MKFQDRMSDQNITVFERGYLDKNWNCSTSVPRHGLIGMRREQMWSATFFPCRQFASTQLHQPDNVGKLSISRAKMIDEHKAWAHRGIGNFIPIQLHERHGVGKHSISWAKRCNFSRIGRKNKKGRLSKGGILMKTEIAGRAYLVTVCGAWKSFNRRP